MSDSPFLRPGADPVPTDGVWPYETPEVEGQPPHNHAAKVSEDSVDVMQRPGTRPPTRRVRAVLIGGIAGLLIGGGAAGWLAASFFADPDPVDITLESFPKYIGNLTRPDLMSTVAKDPSGLEQFARDFEASGEGYRFAYGGDGASVDYGQFLLTIVNGSQPLPLPSNASAISGDASPFLISLDSDTVSCTFLPEVELYSSAVLQAPADLSARGWTQCVLRDVERHLSLKIDSQVPGGAADTSARYAAILGQVQEALVG